MMKRLRMRRARDERGAVAVIVAVSMVVLFGFAAMAYDISNLATHKQELQNTLDTAAHAAATRLPDDPVGAVAAARAMANLNDKDSVPSVDLFCVVASTGADKQVLKGQIPGVCDPGPGWQSRVVCNETICAIPCPATAGNRCNTARVSDREEVDFSFAPVIGINTGSTGDLTSVACRGSCGSMLPNAMDVVVVADRTLSMSEPDLSAMKGGITSMLTTMTPELQYVAFGTIHRGARSYACNDSSSLDSGPWVLTKFHDDYLLPGAPGSRALNLNSKLVYTIGCVTRPTDQRAWGTHLAAAMKGAYTQLAAPNATAGMPKRPGVAQKVIIFETDGMPDESMNYAPVYSTDPAGGQQLARQIMKTSNPWKANAPWSSQTSQQRKTGGVAGCQMLEQAAQLAKNANMIVITIGYGDASTAGCNMATLDRNGNYTTDGPLVKDSLAASASPGLDGKASKADHNCSTPAGVEAENTDGDFFFCAANAKQLAPIFESAIQQVRTGIRFLSLPH